MPRTRFNALIPADYIDGQLYSLPGELSEEEAAQIGAARRWSKAPATLRAYLADWRGWCAYCRIHGREPFPVVSEHVEAYATFLAAARPKREVREAWLALSSFKGRDGRPQQRAAPPYPPSTVERALAGIRYIHRLMARRAPGTADPFGDLALRETVSGIRRRAAAGESRPEGARPLHHERKDGITIEMLREVVDAIDTDTLRGLRDKAIIVTGFVGAMRISELAGLNWGEIEATGDGLIVQPRKSKANQDGRRTDDVIVLPRLDTALCPVRAIEAWRIAAELPKRGPLWARIYDRKDSQGTPTGERVMRGPAGGTGLTPDSTKLILQRALARAKATAPPSSSLQAILARDFAGHSLRRGMATAMAEAGQQIDAIKAALRHRSVATTLKYVDVRDVRQAAAIRETFGVTPHCA